MSSEALVTNRMIGWTARVDQELDCAARAGGTKARKAHLELAILHFDSNCPDGMVDAREMLSAALFTRLAFLADD